MLSLDEIITILKDRNLSEVSRRTGLSIPTIWRIANGQAGNVGYETVSKLSEYLEKKHGE
jgi:transcriptional regulator with XRE-family HTH domain